MKNTIRRMVVAAFAFAIVCLLSADVFAQRCGSSQSSSNSDTLSQLLSSGLLSANGNGGASAVARVNSNSRSNQDVNALARQLAQAMRERESAGTSATATARSGGGLRVYNVPSDSGANAEAYASSESNDSVDFATIAALLDQQNSDVSASASASSNGCSGGSCGRGGAGVLSRAFARPARARRGSETTVARSFSRTTRRN